MVQTDTTPFVVRGESSRQRPRVSRETRRLLMTAFLAVLSLWLLARLRFPDRPMNPNPVPPLLTQLAVLPRFSDLASTVQDVRTRLSPLLTNVGPVGADSESTAGQPPVRVPALRIDDELAVTVLDAAVLAGGREPLGVIARDAGSGLTLLQVDRAESTTIPILWQPQRLDEPRYLIAASPSSSEVWMRPIFVGGLTTLRTPRWSTPVWAVPEGTGLSAGAIVFTEDAELVGIVAPYDGGVAIVPAREVLSVAETMRTNPPSGALDVGIEVQPLTPPLAIASGSENGVVVTWIDRSAAAARELRPGDVIAAIDGEPIRSVDDWRVRMAHGRVGTRLTAQVLRGGAKRDVVLTIDTPVTPPSAPSLGITMRSIAGSGVEIVGVDRGSAAAAAGLETGDMVTAVGGTDAPTAAQVRSAFRSARPGDVLIFAITRGSRHRVVGLQR